MSQTQKKPKVPPTTRRPMSAKERLKAGRIVSCRTPSFVEVQIRPPNLELHALSGSLPARLRMIAEKGIVGIDEALKEAEERADPELLQYLDGIVARTFVEPVFEPPVYELQEDEETEETRAVQVAGDLLDEYLLPEDYKWALLVAFGETDYDGEGKRLWGREPLSRFATFRDEHGCAEDCEGCQRLRALFSLVGVDE